MAKQSFTKHTHQTKDGVKRTPLKTSKVEDFRTTMFAYLKRVTFYLGTHYIVDYNVHVKLRFYCGGSHPPVNSNVPSKQENQQN
jgi:hypothetical protein